MPPPRDPNATLDLWPLEEANIFHVDNIYRGEVWVDLAISYWSIVPPFSHDLIYAGQLVRVMPAPVEVQADFQYYTTYLDGTLITTTERPI